MEKLYQSEIYEKVKAFIDELGDNDAEFMLSDKETRNLESIIYSVTPLAVRNVHIGAPDRMLDGVAYTPTSFAIDSTLKAKADLPRDFLRLVRARLSSWGAPVTEAITEDSPRYRMQSNEYMRGTYNKPVCALVMQVDGSQALELFSAKSHTDTLQMLSILKEPIWVFDPDENDKYIEVCSRLKGSIIAQITGQLLLALREDQRAQMFLQLSSNYSQ